ncbi:MAG: hypothetical protein LBG88_04355 [Christensenellaceae bacterium]|jgi:hypothetical protein|nr:hypothetical protein [Christensenellaceae bacterium]
MTLVKKITAITVGLVLSSAVLVNAQEGKTVGAGSRGGSQGRTFGTSQPTQGPTQGGPQTTGTGSQGSSGGRDFGNGGTTQTPSQPGQNRGGPGSEPAHEDIIKDTKLLRRVIYEDYNKMRWIDIDHENNKYKEQYGVEVWTTINNTENVRDPKRSDPRFYLIRLQDGSFITVGKQVADITRYISTLEKVKTAPATAVTTAPAVSTERRSPVGGIIPPAVAKATPAPKPATTTTPVAKPAPKPATTAPKVAVVAKPAPAKAAVKPAVVASKPHPYYSSDEYRKAPRPGYENGFRSPHYYTEADAQHADEIIRAADEGSAKQVVKDSMNGSTAAGIGIGIAATLAAGGLAYGARRKFSTQKPKSKGSKDPVNSQVDWYK